MQKLLLGQLRPMRKLLLETMRSMRNLGAYSLAAGGHKGTVSWEGSTGECGDLNSMGFPSLLCLHAC